MEIVDYRIHQAVGINPGFRNGKSTLLLTMIAGDRGYASISKGYDINWPNCMSFLSPDEGESSTITFGDGEQWAPTSYGLRVKNSGPRFSICSEFEIQRLGPKQALFIKDDLRIVLPIIQNFPIRSIDWSDPLFEHYRIKGYGLGPITKKEHSEKFNDLSPGNAKRIVPEYGRLKRFSYYKKIKTGGHISVGALADLDRLFDEGQAEIAHLNYYGPIVPAGPGGKWPSSESVYTHLHDRFGAPSAEFGVRTGDPIWMWVHDIDGRFLSRVDDRDDPCLSRAMYSVSRASYPNAEVDAWNCGVIAIYSTGGLRVFHGHAMAHHYFSDRLEVVETAQQNQPVRTEPDPAEQTQGEETRSRRGSH